jgi:hypothetical protein
VIEGLKLTMTGRELRANIDRRIYWHQSVLREAVATLQKPPEETAAPLSPTFFTDEIRWTEQRIDTLTLIRDYVLPDEVYRLTEADLQFADLLPEDDWPCDCFSPRRSHGVGLPPPVTVES